MELTYFQMYLITKLDSVGFFIGFFGLMTLAFYLLCSVDKNSSCPEKWTKSLNTTRGFVIGFLLLFLSILLPSKSDIALIYTIPALVNNQDVQAIPPELAKLARIKLEKMTKEAIK